MQNPDGIDLVSSTSAHPQKPPHFKVDENSPDLESPRFFFMKISIKT